MKNNKDNIIAISGVKNSGKTTLINKLIVKLKEKGLTIAVIKHDGHEFEPDVAGTDSYSYRKSGSDGVGIFSNGRFMIVEQRKVDLDYMLEFFSDKDLIILEGFKDENIKKLEVIREGVSDKPYCREKNLLGYVTNCKTIKVDEDLLLFDIDDIDAISEYIYKYIC